MLSLHPSMYCTLASTSEALEGAKYEFETGRAAISHAFHSKVELLSIPDHWPSQADLVEYCSHIAPGLAALLIVAGVIYALWGHNFFKVLVVLNAAIVGAVAGALLGQKTGAIIPLAIVGAISAGAVTWPTMKYAVAVMGGCFGGLLGATIWHCVGLDARFAWSGALTGLIAGGLLCFIIFRGCIVMFTSLQGAVMLVLGILALLLRYDDVSPHIGRFLSLKPFLLPMCIFVPTVAGMMYQQHIGGATPPPLPAKKSSA